MKLVVQRVSAASVTVGGDVVGEIQKGLCVLVGIARDDTSTDVEHVARRLLGLRLFPNTESGKQWDANVTDINGGVLLISQFTLCHVLKGNKPDFHNAMSGAEAKQLFDHLVASIRNQHKNLPVATGTFGAYMNVHIENDGPVTIQLDTKAT